MVVLLRQEERLRVLSAAVHTKLVLVAGVWVERTVVVWVEAGKAVREAVLVERAAAAWGLVGSAAASGAI